jgi:hypothetical protein
LPFEERRELSSPFNSAGSETTGTVKTRLRYALKRCVEIEMDKSRFLAQLANLFLLQWLGRALRSRLSDVTREDPPPNMQNLVVALARGEHEGPSRDQK